MAASGSGYFLPVADGFLEDGSKLAAAWYLMYLASKLFDEFEDQEIIPGAILMISSEPENGTSVSLRLSVLNYKGED